MQQLSVTKLQTPLQTVHRLARARCQRTLFRALRRLRRHQFSSHQPCNNRNRPINLRIVVAQQRRQPRIRWPRCTHQDENRVIGRKIVTHLPIRCSNMAWVAVPLQANRTRRRRIRRAASTLPQTPPLPSWPSRTPSTAYRALWTRPIHSRSPPSQESRSYRLRSEARWGTSHSTLSTWAISPSNRHRNPKWLSPRVRPPSLLRYVIIFSSEKFYLT